MKDSSFGDMGGMYCPSGRWSALRITSRDGDIPSPAEARTSLPSVSTAFWPAATLRVTSASSYRSSALWPPAKRFSRPLRRMQVDDIGTSTYFAISCLYPLTALASHVPCHEEPAVRCLEVP